MLIIYSIFFVTFRFAAIVKQKFWCFNLAILYIFTLKKKLFIYLYLAKGIKILIEIMNLIYVYVKSLRI